MYCLVIAEKPQAAMKIAYALADIAPVKRNISGIPYWEVNCQNKKLIIASAVGHLFELKKKKQGEWPCFDLEWKASLGFMKKYADTIKSLAEKANEFIISTDYDIEGELIGFNILRFICRQEDAKRMKFSTLTKPDLLASYKDIIENIDFGQAYAGETRHYLDFYYGINLSQALMRAIKSAGTFKILSIGRIQGPTLALVVSKEKAIQEFKPKPYWQVLLLIKNKHEIEVKYPRDIFKKQELKEFEKLKNKIGEAKTEKQEKKLFPWPAFDLTTLQIEAYRFFGLTPAQTLGVAQKLYLRGLISYPRTSSQKLPFTIGYKRILGKLKGFYPKLIAHIKRTMPIEGKKIDAHPAIFPTGEMPKKLTQTEKQVYELIVKRFIACFCKEALIEEKKVIVKVDNKKFFALGKKILEKGWLAVYPTRIQEKEIPDIKGKIKVKDVKIEEKETKPPRRYTAASLISELSKRNLGTKGTRASIIDTLYKRGYIQERQIKATKLGISVASALEKNCDLILDEKLTRKFEKEMELIQKEKSREKMLEEEKKILDEAKKLLTKIAKQFKAKEKKIGKELLKACAAQQEEQRKANTLGLCPACKKGNLIILRSKKGKRFAACNKYPKCKTTFALPQYGLIKLAGKKCVCGFPLLLLIKKGKPPWQFCFNPECPTRKKG